MTVFPRPVIARAAREPGGDILHKGHGRPHHAA